MGYVFLFLGIFFGVTGQMCVKMSQGFKKKRPTVTAFIVIIICIYFISLATNYIEMGVVFAIWAGLTIVCTALLGIRIFGESNTRRKVISILSIIVGVVLLELI